MNSPTLDALLALDPVAALVKMLNLANGTGYRLDAFTVSKPTVVNGIVTQVTLTGKPALNDLDGDRSPGSLTLTYNRLDMGQYLQGALAGYQPNLPLSTQNILDEITARIGQTFYIDDMMLEEVTRDNGALYRLKAKPESLRWIGYIDLPLIALKPLSYLFNTNLLSAVTDVRQVTYSPNAHLPYLNATDYRTFAEGLRVGDLAQDRSTFRTLFNVVVHDPSPVAPQSAPWYASATPGPFNLYNAKVVRFDTGSGLNPAVPNLERAVVVQIDGTYTTNFQSGEIVIPYTMADFTGDGWTNQPRLSQGSSLSLSDGSLFGSYLNTLAVGSTITSVPADFYIDGDTAWEAVDGVPSPTNLYGAVIQYNGLRRASDLPPVYQNLDRVLEVTMSLNNSVWQGEYLFYYAGPIQMPLRELRLTVGSACYVDFTPTKGTGPFTYAVANGVLPDGLMLDPTSGLLTGTATTVGDFQYDVAISDSVGNTCLFGIHQRVSQQVATLTLSGNLPVGNAGETYTAFLKIAGGLAPYTASVAAGRLPGSLALSVIGSTLRLSGLLPAADTYLFAVGVTSADDQRTSLSLSLEVTGEGGYTRLSLDGGYPQAIVGTLYAGALTISGGDGVYSNPRLLSGILPDGLTLSVVGGELQLNGTPTTEGDYGFEVAVDSGDGQTASLSVDLPVVPAQTVTPPATDPYYANVVSLLNLRGTVGDTTIIDESGTAWSSFGTPLPVLTTVNGVQALQMQTVAGNHLQSSSNPALVLGTQDFTLEMWVQFNSLANGPCLVDFRPPNTNGPYVEIGTDTTGAVGLFVNNAVVIASPGGTLTTGAPVHVELGRASGVTKLFVGGQPVGASFADANSYGGDQISLFENAFTTSQRLDGYLYAFRLTKGVCRHTDTFTPDQPPYPTA